ncbi:hypothetical protein [Janthinobacterium tructae]|uniref:hypothetical protein n=1 Tax=Janthinobacterium tructae TaxID=2590869 RepID=UPI00249AB678|nr:hypothetical protein [Janthinobacterium tructae]MDI3292519.1 hypothetical protein [Janthinobacterium tructae]
MKKILFSMLISIIAINANAQSMSTEATAAHKTVLQCLHKYGVKLDDGISSVETIAKVVANSCRQESVQFVNVWTAGVEVDKRQIIEKVFVTNIESASYYILSNRSEKK